MNSDNAEQNAIVVLDRRTAVLIGPLPDRGESGLQRLPGGTGGRFVAAERLEVRLVRDRAVPDLLEDVDERLVPVDDPCPSRRQLGREHAVDLLLHLEQLGDQLLGRLRV